jgi:hypothetical protein
MKRTSGLVNHEDHRDLEEAEFLRTSWEEIRTRLRRTCIAINRNQCELEAMRQLSHLKAEIRLLEQHRMIARLAGLSITAPDAGLRKAAGELLELLESRQPPDPSCPVRPSVKTTAPERRNAPC